MTLILTLNQVREMLHKLEIRQSEVEMDYSNASGALENSKTGMNDLKSKLNAGNYRFTSAETEWMIEEAENLISIDEMNFGLCSRDEQLGLNAKINSMKNLIQKLQNQ